MGLSVVRWDGAAVGPHPAPRGRRPQGTTTVRLDRARGRSCQATHVVLPAGLVAGRSYPLAVIGAALVAAGAGAGSGAVAAQLGVPAGTGPGCAAPAATPRTSTGSACRPWSPSNPTCCPPPHAPPRWATPLDALAAAALATIRRFTPDQPARLWPVINVLTGGRLLAPSFSP